MPDWIEWKGGDCPVSDDTIVEVQIETLAVWEERADQFSWEMMDDGCNIVSYRIVREAS